MEREEYGIMIGKGELGSRDPGFYIPYRIIEEGGGKAGKEFVEEIKRGDYDDGRKNTEPLITAIIRRWLRRH